jgi:hypothetical protein
VEACASFGQVTVKFEFVSLKFVLNQKFVAVIFHLKWLFVTTQKIHVFAVFWTTWVALYYTLVSFAYDNTLPVLLSFAVQDLICQFFSREF